VTWADDPGFQDWLNELLSNAGPEWDKDVAMSAIAIDYVRWLEWQAEVHQQARKGSAIARGPAPEWAAEVIDTITEAWNHGEIIILMPPADFMPGRRGEDGGGFVEP
jgi:hypothetical protein